MGSETKKLRIKSRVFRQRVGERTYYKTKHYVDSVPKKWLQQAREGKWHLEYDIEKKQAWLVLSAPNLLFSP